MPSSSRPSHPRRALPLAAHLAALALAAPLSAQAAAVPLVSFEDPTGDATGPGTYTPPGDTMFQDGDFDLRRFAVLTDGDDVLFVVTMGAPIRTPAVNLQTGSTPVTLDNGLFLQNVDIYVDTDPASTDGSSSCIPGRRVAFADGRTWKAAVVLTPQPGPARAATREALGAAADRITFATGLKIQGRTITARVPAARLGGTPRPSWGWSVQVSGARWEQGFAVVDRLKGISTPDAFTMPVHSTPEAFAFGGGPMGGAHPQVTDALLPPGADQAQVLGSFSTKSGAYAQVPFVYTTPPPPVAAAPTAAGAAVAGAAAALAAAPDLAARPPASPPPAGDAPRPSAPGPVLLSPNLMPRLGPTSSAAAAPPGPADAGPLLVVDVTDDLVSAKGPVSGLQPMQFGRVVDGQGVTVARVMILRLHDQGLLASAIAGKERIHPGVRLLFDPPAAKP